MCTCVTWNSRKFNPTNQLRMAYTKSHVIHILHTHVTGWGLFLIGQVEFSLATVKRHCANSLDQAINTLCICAHTVHTTCTCTHTNGHVYTCTYVHIVPLDSELEEVILNLVSCSVVDLDNGIWQHDLNTCQHCVVQNNSLLLQHTNKPCLQCLVLAA